MAEEGKAVEVMRVCDDLLFMLRYVSSGSPLRVTLSEEMGYTRSYLSLMKNRYADKVTWDIDIPADMMGITVPKLIVQPLVENSLKYGIHVEPPWRIRIAGVQSDGRWTISVADNGTGFAERSLDEISRGMEGILRHEPVPETPLAGMGLLNIFARLRILYGEAAVLRALTLPHGGAMVEIGGRT